VHTFLQHPKRHLGTFRNVEQAVTTVGKIQNPEQPKPPCVRVQAMGAEPRLTLGAPVHIKAVTLQDIDSLDTQIPGVS
jgi:hypothetical protein